MSSPKTLSDSTKVLYGIGLSAEGIKSNAFNVFLLFFYQQIAGLEPTLCGLALLLSLSVDAVVDPAIGARSDSLRSRWGRRHPFMYAGCLPLAFCYWAVFNPPHGTGQLALFLWLLIFSIGTRVAMALFVIPHQSLVPELTSDPLERTALMSVRTAFAWIFGLANGFIGYVFFLRPSPAYPSGLLNPHGYGPFALFGAVVMFVTMVVSALTTQKQALAAQDDVVGPAHVKLTELPRSLRNALRNPSFRAVAIAGLFLSIGYGLSENLNNYMNVFFWGFTSAQVGRFILVIFLASLFVLSTARPLVRRFDCRSVAVACSTVTMVGTTLLVTLRAVGFMPNTGAPALFRMLAVGTFFIYSAVILGMTVMATMIANVTDEYELSTGHRQEGLLFAVAMFISKAASGIGVMIAGIVVKLAGFPEKASPDSISVTAVRNLGFGAAFSSFLVGAISLWFFRNYTLDRTRHAGVVAELTKARAARIAAAE